MPIGSARYASALIAAFNPGTSPPPVSIPNERMGLDTCSGIAASFLSSLLYAYLLQRNIFKEAASLGISRETPRFLGQ